VGHGHEFVAAFEPEDDLGCAWQEGADFGAALIPSSSARLILSVLSGALGTVSLSKRSWLNVLAGAAYPLGVFLGNKPPEFGCRRARRRDGYTAAASGVGPRDTVRRFGEQLMPLVDRANRMFIRNLAAIKDLRQRPVPAIAIGRAERVTVGQPRPAKRTRKQRP
jgi:hypothetical protein